MDFEIIESDRISELPVFLLHRIMSSLPRKDAAKTSSLSKHWNSVWHSFPILKFELYDYVKRERLGMPTPGYAEKCEKWLNFVDESLKKFNHNKLRVEVLTLSIGVIDDKYVPMVDTWMPLALHNGAYHISFRVFPNDDYYPLPETTFSIKANPGSSRFYQLQKIRLSCIYLNENIIGDMILNCPNISDLSLWFFYGLKTLELSRLEKLKELAIGVQKNVLEIERLTVDAPLLEVFRFVSYEQNLHCVIQLTCCHALRHLQLRSRTVTDDWLRLYLSRSPLLEYLDLYKCNMLRNFRISSKQLKILMLHKLEGLLVAQVHAPNLSDFDIRFRKNMPILLVEDVVPCSIEIKHRIKQTNGPYDIFWFLELREFLGFSAQGINFTLLVDEVEVSFDLEALPEAAIPPPVSVDLLYISYGEISSQLDCAALIDGLLWSCHPKAISFGYPVEQDNCIKVLCEKLLEREQPLCCKLSNSKCWRHSLKRAKIEDFGGIEDESFAVNHLLDSLSGQELYITLDWDH